MRRRWALPASWEPTPVHSARWSRLNSSLAAATIASTSMAGAAQAGTGAVTPIDAGSAGEAERAGTAGATVAGVRAQGGLTLGAPAWGVPMSDGLTARVRAGSRDGI